MMIGDDVWVNIKRDEDTAYLSFQGTATVRGVLIDANFPAMIYKDEKPKWRVHRGFGKSFKTAIDTIARYLDGCKRVVVYAFSKGAGYGPLMHEWCVFNGYDVTTYCFGAPAIMYAPSKVIRERFKNLYNISIRGDWCSIIACLVGYVHVGQPVNLGELKLDIWKNYHTKYEEYLKDL